MYRKFLSYFILLFWYCFSVITLSAQIEITSYAPINPNDLPPNAHIESPRYIGFEYEKERLDLTAKVWRYNTNQDIMLIIWGDESKADELWKKSGEYLVETHKIPRSKITIITVNQPYPDLEMKIYLENPEDKNKNWFEKLSKIRVGVSTKRDFEQTFPPYDFEVLQTSDSKTKIKYETYEGDAIVVYSNGKCSESPELDCPICKKPQESDKLNLPKDTIISLSFNSFIYLKFPDLNLDISQFKTQQGEKPKTWLYTNENSGITYGISEDVKLNFLSLDLSKEQKQKFKCANRT